MFGRLVFISYTLRGNEISRELLSNLKLKLKDFAIDTYIDLLDNDKIEGHQAYVFAKLAESDMLLLIQSAQVYHSVWVREELKYASKLGKPILPVSLCDIRKMLTLPSVNFSWSNLFEHKKGGHRI